MKNIPYSRQSIDKKDIKEMLKVLSSNWITQGPKINEFEADLCKFTGAKYAVVVANGTAALHCACIAAEIEKDDYAITSPFSFAASANCVLYCGGNPLFSDIQPDTFNIDPDKIRELLFKHRSSNKTKIKAIIPVHYAGHPCELDIIKKIADAHDCFVIEDAAHALGATFKGTKIGSCAYSDMTIFSFHPVKHITTGEGGAILTNNKEHYKKLLLVRNHGITKESNSLINKDMKDCGWYYEMQSIGFNYRITDFQSALGISQLKKCSRFLDLRRKIAKSYQDAFIGNHFFDIPVERENVKSSYHLYPIKLKEKYINKRKLIFNNMRSNGLGVQIHYIPIHLQPFYQNKFGYKAGNYPIAENIYKRVISLPVFPGMSKKDVQRIVKITYKVFESLGS
ncbi:MAG: UDP-4-amino-4,6-dideoxy-N-acetyl-beta-L-altrosamine transaminase [bacterium]